MRFLNINSNKSENRIESIKREIQEERDAREERARNREREREASRMERLESLNRACRNVPERYWSNKVQNLISEYNEKK